MHLRKLQQLIGWKMIINLIHKFIKSNIIRAVDLLSKKSQSRLAGSISILIGTWPGKVGLCSSFRRPWPAIAHWARARQQNAPKL